MGINKEQMLKLIESRIDTMQALTGECIELIYNAGYNDGLEAAAKLCEHDGYVAQEIRKLKK